MPDILDGIAQEHAAKLLGVIFTGKLSFEDHLHFDNISTDILHRVVPLR